MLGGWESSLKSEDGVRDGEDAMGWLECEPVARVGCVHRVGKLGAGGGLPNEPNFVQAGVEKFGKRTQKRSQFPLRSVQAPAAAMVWRTRGSASLPDTGRYGSTDGAVGHRALPQAVGGRGSRKKGGIAKRTQIHSSRWTT